MLYLLVNVVHTLKEYTGEARVWTSVNLHVILLYYNAIHLGSMLEHS